MENNKTRIETRAITELQKGKLNPLEAVILLNKEIGGITGVRWNPGKNQYKIYNHKNTKHEQLPVRGANKRFRKLLENFAILSYWTAQKNGYTEPGEIHLSKQVSSKHHQFKKYLTKTLSKYQN